LNTPHKKSALCPPLQRHDELVSVWLNPVTP
jgi:hypothetical protein